MLEINGSYGEGGGQILRNAVALSTVIKKPIKIKNIRVNRPNPGIKAQHYVAIKSIQELCDAETKGLEIGSSKLTFIPGDFKGGDYKFDIGTAGSITLVFQALILASLKSDTKTNIRLTGGTDVKWSPTWDYFQHVFIPIIKKTGISVDTQLIKRGYYPRGGGEAVITIGPVSEIKPLQLDKETQFSLVKGMVQIAQLSDNISTRIKNAAIKTLIKGDLKPDIKIEQNSSLSPGTSITLWAESNDIILGSTVLGERGLPSEEIGNNAATNLLNEIKSNSTLDIHAFDQLLPYMAIAQGVSSCIVKKISSHAQTNMWLIKRLLDTKFEAKQEENHIRININKP
jgi:RNA 3'-phosphate cyclase